MYVCICMYTKFLQILKSTFLLVLLSRPIRSHQFGTKWPIVCWCTVKKLFTPTSKLRHHFQKFHSEISPYTDLKLTNVLLTISFVPLPIKLFLPLNLAICISLVPLQYSILIHCHHYAATNLLKVLGINSLVHFTTHVLDTCFLMVHFFMHLPAYLHCHHLSLIQSFIFLQSLPPSHPLVSSGVRTDFADYRTVYWSFHDHSFSFAFFVRYF